MDQQVVDSHKNVSLGGFEPSTLGVGNLRSHPLSYKLKFNFFSEILSPPDQHDV